MTTTTPLNAICAPAGRQRLRRFVRVIALCQLCLMVATWPLWFNPDAFPVVPLTSWAPRSNLADCTSAVLLVAGLVGVLCRPDAMLRFAGGSGTGSRLAAGAVLAAGAFLVLTNQHRLQAWHWFNLTCLLQCLIFPSQTAIKSVRLTTAAIYLFSGLSRVTSEPATGMTIPIIRALTSAAGLDPWPVSPAVAYWLSGILITGEVLTGLLLLSAAFRRLGTILALALHLALLVALGPLGLNHETAVLIWNVSFLVIVPLMFFRRDAPATGDAPGTRPGRRCGPRERIVTVMILLLTVGIPLSGLMAIADNWPSWQLYSSRPEVWGLFVRSDAVDQLPEVVRRYLGQPPPLEDWVPVRLDRWSLAATGSPMYPEDRFQLAVMESVVRGIRDELAVRVEIDSPEVPRWWRRRRETVFGVSGLRSQRRHFFLNSECQQPRQLR